MTPPIRHHLVFGCPASGKTTVAIRIVGRLKLRRQRVVMNWQAFDRLPDWKDLKTDGVMTVEDLIAYRFDATDDGSDETPREPSDLVRAVATNAYKGQFLVSPQKESTGRSHSGLDFDTHLGPSRQHKPYTWHCALS